MHSLSVCGVFLTFRSRFLTDAFVQALRFLYGATGIAAILAVLFFAPTIHG